MRNVDQAAMPTKQLPKLAVERSDGKLVVLIDDHPVKVEQKKAALLACLYESIGCVIPREKLCEVIGCRSLTPQGRLHVLQQHLHRLKDILNGAGYVIAAAREVGYALCPLEMEQRKLSPAKVETTLMPIEEKDIVALLRAEVQKFESIAAWARHASVDRTNVSSAIHQKKTDLSENVARPWPSEGCS